MTRVIVRSGGSSAGKSTIARAQAVAVHTGVGYDVAVDTTGCSAIDCARQIAEAAACH